MYKLRSSAYEYDKITFEFNKVNGFFTFENMLLHSIYDGENYTVTVPKEPSKEEKLIFKQFYLQLTWIR